MHTEPLPSGRMKDPGMGGLGKRRDIELLWESLGKSSIELGGHIEPLAWGEDGSIGMEMHTTAVMDRECGALVWEEVELAEKETQVRGRLGGIAGSP